MWEAFRAIGALVGRWVLRLDALVVVLLACIILICEGHVIVCEGALPFSVERVAFVTSVRERPALVVFFLGAMGVGLHTKNVGRQMLDLLTCGQAGPSNQEQTRLRCTTSR